MEGDNSEQRERYYFLRGWLSDVFSDPKFRMEDYFTIKQPEGALLFLNLKEFADFCKDFTRENPSMEIDAEPDKYPCVGFPVCTYHEEGRKDKKVFAFVYLHASEDDIRGYSAKSEWEPLDRFELAMLHS